nr:DUF2799 domain-containing protein [uncultured Desulfobulbus sp.]
MKGWLSIVILLLLGGCASLNQRQCLEGDWYGLGVIDGKAGESIDRLNVHNRACGQYGVTIDERQYFSGRNEGLQTYCRLENAFTTGLAGLRYGGVCPPELDATFAHYNNAAYAVYRTKMALDNLQAQISERELRLQASRYREDRSLLRRDLDDLEFRYDELRRDLRENQRYLEYLQREAARKTRP